jgi:hypothetical protein
MEICLNGFTCKVRATAVHAGLQFIPSQTSEKATGGEFFVQSIMRSAIGLDPTFSWVQVEGLLVHVDLKSPLTTSAVWVMVSQPYRTDPSSLAKELWKFLKLFSRHKEFPKGDKTGVSMQE